MFINNQFSVIDLNYQTVGNIKIEPQIEKEEIDIKAIQIE